MGERLFLQDMNPDQVSRVEGRMRPGKNSVEGFLSMTESLRSIVEKDSKVLGTHGVTHEQVAERLEFLMRQAMGYYGFGPCKDNRRFYKPGRRMVVGGRFSLDVDLSNGLQECPFSGPSADLPPFPFLVPGLCCGSGNREISVINLAAGIGFRYTDLAIHLIRDHHFFEGHTRWRVEPEDAMRVLELG